MRWQDTAEQILKELGVVLEEEQSAIFYDDADYKVVCGGEGSGKSFLGSLYMCCRSFHDALESEREGASYGDLYWLVGADYEDARMEMGTKGDDNYLVGWMDQLEDVDSANTSTPARHDQFCILTTLRYKQSFKLISGYDPLKVGREEPTGILGCEVSRWTKELWERVFGRLSRRRPYSWCWLSGSPENALGDFADYIRLGQIPNGLGVKSYSMPSWVNKAVFPGGRQDAAIKQLEASMTRDRFMRRHGGILLPPADAIFPEFNAEATVANVSYKVGTPVHLFVDPGNYVYAVLAVQFLNDEVCVIDEIYVRDWSHAQIVKACMAKIWWKDVARGTHVMDTGGTQHHMGNPSAWEAWYDTPGLSFNHQKVAVQDSIERVRSLLELNPATGRPRLLINPACSGLICELGGGPAPLPGIHIWRHRNGIPEHANDHSAKALAYGLIHHFGTSRPESQDGWWEEEGEDSTSNSYISSYLEDAPDRSSNIFEELLRR